MINLQGKLKEKLSKHRNFILYALIGITGVTIDLVSFFILYNVFHIHEQLANILSTSMGITNNFIPVNLTGLNNQDFYDTVFRLTLYRQFFLSQTGQYRFNLFMKPATRS